MNANSEHKRREDWLISTMFLAGSVCFTLAFFSQTIEDPFALACMVLITALCEVLSVRLYFDGRVSVSFVGSLLSTILFGPLGGVLAAASVAMTGFFTASRNPRKLVFNFGHATAAAALTPWGPRLPGTPGWTKRQAGRIAHAAGRARWARQSPR